MSQMEHKPKPSFITTCFYISLILTLPYFSRGAPRSEELDSEIYEIDYKGPKTHSSVPPPDNSHGKPHKNSPVDLTGSTSGAIMEEKDKKVHG